MSQTFLYCGIYSYYYNSWDFINCRTGKNSDFHTNKCYTLRHTVVKQSLNGMSVPIVIVDSFLTKSTMYSMGVACLVLYLAKIPYILMESTSFPTCKHSSIYCQQMGNSSHICEHLWPVFFASIFFFKLCRWSLYVDCIIAIIAIINIFLFYYTCYCSLYRYLHWPVKVKIRQGFAKYTSPNLIGLCYCLVYSKQFSVCFIGMCGMVCL